MDQDRYPLSGPPRSALDLSVRLVDVEIGLRNVFAQINNPVRSSKIIFLDTSMSGISRVYDYIKVRNNNDCNSLEQSYISGVLDALNLSCVYRVAGNTSVSVNFLDVLVYNGIINLGSLLLFRHILEPIIQSLFAELHNSSVHWVVSTLWVAPVFLISFIVNVRWLDDISTKATTIVGTTPNRSASSATPSGLDEKELSKYLAKQVKSMLEDSFNRQQVYASFFPFMLIVQSSLFALIPFVGGLFNVIIFSWLYSYYCFDYKWTEEKPGRKLRYIEDNLSYFTGFGMVVCFPFLMASTYMGFWFGYAVWHLTYPLFIITAIGSREQLILSRDASAQPKWRPFVLAKGLNRFFLNLFAVGARFVSGGRTK
ncbi:p53-induced protein 8 [Planoprotostelium fungivorum]|uniref:p53-induced protein 8 n=1 Tax=Planoprotostelium fungivorum TaxID=1890364 RepID=A0A2P6NEV9_9EUKA|nr:p53-induced protein 8 [Planoprotostelium fungivorum]